MWEHLHKLDIMSGTFNSGKISPEKMAILGSNDKFIQVTDTVPIFYPVLS